MRITVVLLMMLSILMAVPFNITARAGSAADMSSWQTMAHSQMHPAGKRASRYVIEFGHGGGNLRPYKIAIAEDGRVKVLEGAPPLKTKHVPSEKVRELLSQAANEDFWNAKQREDEAKPVLPDFGFVFVKVRVQSQPSRVINKRGPQAGPLGEYYQTLSDLVLAQP
jgi:hypothetical protein